MGMGNGKGIAGREVVPMFHLDSTLDKGLRGGAMEVWCAGMGSRVSKGRGLGRWESTMGAKPWNTGWKGRLEGLM